MEKDLVVEDANPLRNCCLWVWRWERNASCDIDEREREHVGNEESFGAASA